MYAEAILQAEGDGAFAEALEYVDRIRARAGVVQLQAYIATNSGMMPQLHISRQVHGPTPYTTANANALLTHIRRVERPLELCFEGHRWKDLVRWGIVKDVFEALRADEIWRENNKEILDIANDGVSPLFIAERIRPDFNIAVNNYTPAQFDYFPIPAQEVQANDKLNGD